jgi:hypothetical protein
MEMYTHALLRPKPGICILSEVWSEKHDPHFQRATYTVCYLVRFQVGILRWPLGQLPLRGGQTGMYASGTSVITLHCFDVFTIHKRAG